MKLNNIVVIEDDSILSSQLKEILEMSQFRVHLFQSAEDYLLSRQAVSQPCIFLIDLNLPGLGGTELIKVIRHNDKLSSIFVLTGADPKDAFSIALSAGADDFLSKPYNPDHLLLKVQNTQRKLEVLVSLNIDYGVKLVPEARMISCDGVKVKLTNREYLIAKELFSAPGEIQGREKIIRSFSDSDITERTIDVHVSSLRRKIAGLGLEIETCRGKGYRLSGLEAKAVAI